MNEIATQQALNHIASSWPWFIVRAAGLTSAVLLVILVVSGIGLITGLTFRVWPPIKAWAIHRSIGISLIITISCHVIFLLFDKYVNYSAINIFVPFTNSIWLTFGVLAFYLLAVVIYTSLTIFNGKKKLWKIIHFLTYPIIIFIFFHALNMGTDLKSGLFRIIWIIFGIVIFIAILTRLWRAKKVWQSQ